MEDHQYLDLERILIGMNDAVASPLLHFSLTLGAHAPEGYSVSVSVRPSFLPSVCLLPRFLRLRATRQQNSDTNGFIATLASLKGDFRITAAFKSYGVKSK